MHKIEDNSQSGLARRKKTIFFPAIYVTRKDEVIMERKLAQLKVKLEADNSLKDKLFVMENAEEIQSLLKEQQLDFSLEEINSIRNVLVKAIEKGENGELSEAALEEVAMTPAIELHINHEFPLLIFRI